MNFQRALFAFSVPLAVAACSAPSADEPAAAASQDMTDAWLESNIPAGSALEGKVLALVNDRTMSAASFQSECGYTSTQAANLMAYRQGDTFGPDDDQRFNTLQELDAVPFTDATFWANTVRCAILHTAGPSVCVPGDHAPVVVELVVDESGSMSGEKWDATRDSLLALFARLHAAGDPNTLVGVIGFDDMPQRRVAPKPVTTLHLTELRDVIDKDYPHGGATGIKAALTSAINVVEAVATGPDTHRIVVLLSDGAPSGGQVERAESIQLVQDAQVRGVDVYAVGIGAFPSDSVGSYDPAFMGQLAVAGGTAPAGCDPASTDLAGVCHVQITPGAGVTQLKNDITEALDAISEQSAAPANCP